MAGPSVRQMPYLPGDLAVADVLAITIVRFERGRIRSERILWDHATLTAQLGLADPMPRSA